MSAAPTCMQHISGADRGVEMYSTIFVGSANECPSCAVFYPSMVLVAVMYAAKRRHTQKRRQELKMERRGREAGKDVPPAHP